MKPLIMFLALSAPAIIAGFSSADTTPEFSDTKWETVETAGKPNPRHEAAFVGFGDRIYLLGGRRIQPVDIYDPATKSWTHASEPPVEVHHFQPVVWEGKIWLVGAMTGKYPKEQALDFIPTYDPVADQWGRGGALPEGRRRGGAGAVIHDGKLYVVCGIINGHWDGNVAWLDVLDLKTGEWSQLPDAPHQRDHFQVAVIDGKIYAAGGRRTNAKSKHVFDQVVPELDIYDIEAGTWSTASVPIPTPRAGSMSLALDGALIVGGGEVNRPKPARREIERYSPKSGKWDALPSLVHGRHGSGIVCHHGSLYIASGCGARGGKPELDTTECMKLPKN